MQELAQRIDELEATVKNLSAQLDERKVVHKQVYYEKSALSNWNISETTARRYIKSGVLEGFKFGKKIYVKVEELEQRIKEGKILTGVAA